MNYGGSEPHSLLRAQAKRIRHICCSTVSVVVASNNCERAHSTYNEKSSLLIFSNNIRDATNRYY
jgi:hypothetical protein